MAYEHPFDIALEKYLLEDSRRRICIEGDLGVIGTIKDLGTTDFIMNLTSNNLVMHGWATHLILDDCEILMKVDGGQQIINRLVWLKHLEGCV